MNIYCITHKKVDFIEELNLIPSGVGSYNYPKNYENEKVGKNISEKNSSYGEFGLLASVSYISLPII